MNNNSIDQSIFKAYDIRGLYPQEINENLAYKIAQVYVSLIKPTKPIVVGRDIRLHSESLQKAVMSALTDAGVEVIDIGLASIEMLYYMVGRYKLSGGIHLTASHNPPQWHGVKMVRDGVVPVAANSGMEEIKNFVQTGKKIQSSKKGNVESREILDEFCRFLLSTINPALLKNFKIVYNPNFGFEGKILERLVSLGNLKVNLIPLNSEPDGNFPKGSPDPMLPQNRQEFIDLVKRIGADFGVTWDADADRVFFCTDGGVFLQPYYTNALLTKILLQNAPKNSKVIYDTRYTWAMIDTAKESGGIPIQEKAGRSNIEHRMHQEQAIFGAETSGHTYFQNFWYVESGMLPFLLLWQYLSVQNKSLFELARPIISQYPISDEINLPSKNGQDVIKKVVKSYPPENVSTLDGVSIEFPTWRANLRLSNTEPLLRLNIEAKTREIVEAKRLELSDLIKKSN